MKLTGMSEESDDEEFEDFERSRKIEEIHEKYAVAISPNAAYILNLGLRIDPNIGKLCIYTRICIYMYAYRLYMHLYTYTYELSWILRTIIVMWNILYVQITIYRAMCNVTYRSRCIAMCNVLYVQIII
jgi:hypothetical protein